MKKLFLALVAATGMFAAASAQRTEIAVSYGGYTQMDATDCHDDWDHVNNAWGAVTAAVNFNVARNSGSVRATHSPAPPPRVVPTTRR